MASLSNTKISDTYPLLLKIETNGVDGTLKSIEDGDGTTSALKISSGAIQVDNIKVDGNAITSTDTNGNIDLTPNGSGEVNISKVDIDSGAIDGTPIGANSANTGAFTTLTASGNATFTGDIIIDADDKALVLGADQDASIWATDVGNVYIGSGQDFTLSSGDTEGWFNFKVGTSAESFLNIVGGEGGVSSLYMTADQADDNADRWRLQSDTSGNFTISTFSSGSYASAISIDSSQDVTFADDVNATGNITTDGIFKVDSAPDSDVIQFDQSGRKSAIQTYFASSSTGSKLILKVSNGNTDGSMIEALDIRPAMLDLPEGYQIRFGERGNLTHDSSNYNMTFNTNSLSNALVITGTGNVGIGGSPATKFHVGDGTASDYIEARLQGGSDNGKGSVINFMRGGTSSFYVGSVSALQGGSESSSDGAIYAFTGNGIRFYTNGNNERMRITSGGDVGIGETSPLNKFYVVETESKAVATFYNTRNPSSSPPHCLDLNFAYTPDNTTSYFVRGQDNLGAGSAVAEFHIYSDGSFVQSSDRRMKENIVDSENQLDKINQLKVRDYNKINDSSKKKHIGFIAQELQEVFPHLVIEAEDEAKTLQIYKVGIVPLLVKAVQELSAKVEALENA